MDNNKRNLIILSCTIIAICLVSVITATRYFNKGTSLTNGNTDYNSYQENIVQPDDNEEINLGDGGHCNPNSGVPSSVCSGKTKANCSSPCYWWEPTPAPTAKPTATPAPTATPTPTPLVCTSGQYKSNGSCVTCEKGYKCDGEDRTACGAGTYQDSTGQSSCITCEAGYKCAGDVNKNHTACGKGKYQDATGSTTCKDCEAGYYCPNDANTSQTACADNTYTDKTKQSACKTCGVDAVKDDHTGCQKCSVSVEASTKKISPSEVGSYKINLSKCVGTLTLTCTGGSCSSTTYSVAPTSAGYLSTVTAEKKCSDITIKGTLSNDGKTKSAGSATIKVMDEWVDYCSDCDLTEDLPTNLIANWDADDTYGTGKKEYTDESGTFYHYTLVRTRACTKPYKPKFYTFCCVDNEVPGLSENVVPVEKSRKAESTTCNFFAKQAGKPKADYTMLFAPPDGDFDMKKCVEPPEIPGTCKQSDIDPTDKVVNTTTCEDTVEFSVSDGVKCTNKKGEKKSFYKIECSKDMSTKFDYGDDGKDDSERYLYKGQGFKFGIYVDTSVYCEYRFYDTVWKEVYDKFVQKIDLIDEKLADYVKNNDPDGWEKYITDHIKDITVKKEDNVKYLYELWNIIDDLKEIVENYNNYKTSDAYDENGKLSLTTKEDGVDVSITESFDQKIIDEGEMKKTNVTKKTLGIKDLTDPEDYNLSNALKPRKIKLSPQKVCINEHDGTISLIEKTADCDDKNISGGRKVYIGKKTDEGKYDMSIKVAGLGTNDAKVNNNKCDVEVLPYEIRYRSIDVGNAFINKDWNKGENWVNAQYDFTNTIKANIWSGTSNQNVIEIPGDDIKSIQNSNANYRNPKKDSTTGEMKLTSPYLGLCDVESYSDHDDITKKICDAIK